MGINDVDINKVTPMMRQYIEIKQKNKDIIIFFRLGDFYEMFFEDAVNALLSYIGFLVLIPYLGEKKNKYVRFHALEGMNLFIYELILGGILTFVNIFIPLTFLRSLFSTIVSLICLALSIIGIINVCNDQAKELPVINKMKIIKK